MSKRARRKPIKRRPLFLVVFDVEDVQPFTDDLEARLIRALREAPDLPVFVVGRQP